MKRKTLAALAIITLASCAKESSPLDPTQVEATFASSSITRVANNEWEANDKIGVTMTKATTTTLAEGDYSNTPYTVSAAGATASFSPDSKVIYLPTDGSSVDFYAYCPYTATIDSNNDIDVDITSQNFTKIDLVATKATGATKESPKVVFSGDNAFKHQLSKLTISLKIGTGISDLTGLSTTIKGQYTTAKYNTLTSAISSEGDIANITVATTVATAATTATAEAILIPTAAIAGSTVVFTLDGEDYIWNTSAVELVQGSEHTYEITITKTGLETGDATINKWGEGTGGTGTAE